MVWMEERLERATERITGARMHPANFLPQIRNRAVNPAIAGLMAVQANCHESEIVRRF
jgi:hypothetical protein